MRLGWIELTDYRSYPSLQYKPDASVNVLVGANAAGKTNLLEAIAYLGALKSFRNAPEAALVTIGSDAAVIRGEIQHGDSASLVEIEIPASGRRRVQVNRQRLVRTSDLLGHLRIVVFLPDDLDIIKRSPAYRRDFIDEVAIQLWPGSHLDQAEYDRALRQRNTLLRQMGRDTDAVTLGVWNERLSEAGAKVMVRRANSMELLAERVDAAYRALAGEGTPVSFAYESEWGGSLDPSTSPAEHQAKLWAALESAERSDKDRRTTTVGLHRDEPLFFLGGRPSRTHASQGEQRTLVLSLRLASHHAVSTLTGLPPLLVLDDVFSELDMSRASALAAALPDAQTFITTARDEEVPVDGHRWTVKPGGIK